MRQCLFWKKKKKQQQHSDWSKQVTNQVQRGWKYTDKENLKKKMIKKVEEKTKQNLKNTGREKGTSVRKRKNCNKRKGK